MFLKIKEKEYQIKFTFNKIAHLEEKSGKGIAELLKEEAIGFSTIRLLLWGALYKELGNITLEQAGEIAQELVEEGMTFSDLAELFVKGLMESGLLSNNSEKK